MRAGVDFDAGLTSAAEAGGEYTSINKYFVDSILLKLINKKSTYHLKPRNFQLKTGSA